MIRYSAANLTNLFKCELESSRWYLILTVFVSDLRMSKLHLIQRIHGKQDGCERFLRFGQFRRRWYRKCRMGRLVS